jgi:Flp pilus assembly protein CpaB
VFRLRRPRSPVHTLRRALAVLFAAGALALALQPPPTADAGPPTAPVVVAADDLPTGTTLTAGDLRISLLPLDAVPAGRAEDPATLFGRRLAAAVRIGEPVTDVRLVGPRLWDRVPAGQVAAPVRLADLAVSTLLRAGDRVDVLATTPEAGARVVADGALVLTTDAPPPGTDPRPAGDGGLLVLAVDHDTAARLAAAAAGGTLTVTLGRP